MHYAKKNRTPIYQFRKPFLCNLPVHTSAFVHDIWWLPTFCKPLSNHKTNLSLTSWNMQCNNFWAYLLSWDVLLLRAVLSLAYFEMPFCWCYFVPVEKLGKRIENNTQPQHIENGYTRRKNISLPFHFSKITTRQIKSDMIKWAPWRCFCASEKESQNLN